MRRVATAGQQRGLTFTNFMLVAILLVFGAIMGMRVIPAYVDDKQIQHILDTIAHDPNMQDASPNDIRNSWDKRSVIDNITVVGPQDIQIERKNGYLYLSVKYNVKIGLVGNASLLLEFDTHSTRPK